MIDIHCHIDKDDYENLDNFYKNIKNGGVEKIIINGYDSESNRIALLAAEKHDNIYAAVGFHPSEANKVTDNDFLILKEQLKHQKVVAIGEIGLDYYWNKENKKAQKKLFIKQLELAKKYNKPVIIHNREATTDIYNVLKKYNICGVMHSFSETLDWAQKFIKINFLLGISGMVTFKKMNWLKEVIKKVPIEYILVETDSPYLTPEPFRGKKNSPAYLFYILKEITKIKGLTEEKAKELTTSNAVRLFDI